MNLEKTPRTPKLLETLTPAYLNKYFQSKVYLSISLAICVPVKESADVKILTMIPYQYNSKSKKWDRKKRNVVAGGFDSSDGTILDTISREFKEEVLNNQDEKLSGEIRDILTDYWSSDDPAKYGRLSCELDGNPKPNGYGDIPINVYLRLLVDEPMKIKIDESKIETEGEAGKREKITDFYWTFLNDIHKTPKYYYPFSIKSTDLVFHPDSSVTWNHSKVFVYEKVMFKTYLESL